MSKVDIATGPFTLPWMARWRWITRRSANCRVPFDFADLKVFKDGLSLGDAALPMHDVASVNVMLNGDLQLSLNQYGFGVTDNRFWIALAGGVTYDDQSLTATAKLYHDGEFVLSQLTGDNLLIAIGDFTLRTSFDYSGGTITEAEGSLHLGALMASIPDALKNSLGELPVTIHNVNVDLSDPSAPKLSSGSIAFHTPFQMVTPFFTAQINGIEVGASGRNPLRQGARRFHCLHPGRFPAHARRGVADQYRPDRVRFQRHAELER